MKKLYLLINILALLFVTNILSGCTPGTEISNVHSIELSFADFIQSPSQIFTYEEGDSASKEIIALINSGLENEPITGHEISGDITLDVTFNDETTRQFIVDFDLINNVGFLTEDGITYSIDSANTASFIESPYFMSYFDLKFVEPMVSITIDSEKANYFYNNQFNYRAFNNTEIANATTNIEEMPSTTEDLYTLVNDQSIIAFNSDQSPTNVVQNIYLEDELIDSFILEDSKIILPSTEGSYRITLDCTWDNSSDKTYYGSASYELYVELDLPVEFSISNARVNQGDMLIITASHVNDGQEIILDTELLDSITIYKNGEDSIGFIPIYTLTTPDEYVITASTREPNYAMENFTSFDVTVLDVAFVEQQLTASSSMNALLTDENYAYDNALIDHAYSSPIQEKLFEGTFMAPAEGRISTEFGTERYTNGGSTPRIHAAIDIAVPQGTPVAATNTGVVALSEALYIKGNTVIIDHGMGIYSLYYHLDELYLEEGDEVTKGDIIGTVGSTGYSTGAHLHFGVRQDGTYINPWTLYEEVLLED